MQLWVHTQAFSNGLHHTDLRFFFFLEFYNLTKFNQILLNPEYIWTLLLTARLIVLFHWQIILLILSIYFRKESQIWSLRWAQGIV